jgi:hypothetical protein
MAFIHAIMLTLMKITVILLIHTMIRQAKRIAKRIAKRKVLSDGESNPGLLRVV